MIEQTMTVVAVKGNRAELQAQTKEPCEGCNGRCGSQVFSKLFKTDKKTLWLQLDEPVEVGQKVKLALDDSKLVQHSIYVYLVPLLFALMLAAFAAQYLQMGDAGQLVSAAIGGSLGVLFAKTRTKSFQHDIKLIKIYPISLPLTQIDGD
ncbi:Sigma factor RpoE regulatory protein RseC [Pseudoalteromonas luteoviolacea B = ATCC 29581]|nr:Sigma factor RpoE regulatory protein RseC [Pseudoalteromonas luteoviolacea B = ATCC 29581]